MLSPRARTLLLRPLCDIIYSSVGLLHLARLIRSHCPGRGKMCAYFICYFIAFSVLAAADGRVRQELRRSQRAAAVRHSENTIPEQENRNIRGECKVERITNGGKILRGEQLKDFRASSGSREVTPSARALIFSPVLHGVAMTNCVITRCSPFRFDSDLISTNICPMSAPP